MSYLRGEFYTWVGNGCPPDCPNSLLEGNASMRCREHDYISISGMMMPLRIFDLLVAMRYAQLVEEGIVEAVEAEATETAEGNFGGWALQRKRGRNPEQELHEYLDKAAEQRARLPG